MRSLLPTALAIGLCWLPAITGAQAKGKGERRKTAPAEEVQFGMIGLLDTGEGPGAPSGKLPKGAIAQGQNGLRAIAVDKTSVYWLTVDSVLKAPLGGGRAVVLALGLAPSAFALDAKNVYWAAADPTSMLSTISSVPLSGGRRRVLAQHEPGAGEVAVDATHVYWTSSEGDGAIKRVPLAGGPAETFERLERHPISLAVDETNVYWTSDFGEVFKQAKTADEPVRLAEMQMDARHLTIAGPSLYWTAGGGMIMKVTVAGGEPTVVAEQQSFANGLAVHAGRLYFARRLTSPKKGGVILSVPLAGGEPKELASGQAEPIAVAAGPKGIYWLNRGDGTVHKLAK